MKSKQGIWKLVVVVVLVVALVVLAGMFLHLRTQYQSVVEECALLRGEVSELAANNTLLQEKLNATLPYSKASGTPIQLLNNFDEVHNPTWQELKSFLAADNTSDETYWYGFFMCGDFAEMLHNNAEAAGLRSAVAIIHFAKGSPHALNAFYTVDNGLIFIDSTGASFDDKHFVPGPFGFPGFWISNKGEDKVAYVVEGEECGLVSVAVVDAFNYSWYEDYAVRWKDYDQQAEAYNAEARRPSYYGSHRYERLLQEQAKLEEMRATLGDYWYEPLGVVSSVELFW